MHAVKCLASVAFGVVLGRGVVSVAFAFCTDLSPDSNGMYSAFHRSGLRGLGVSVDVELRPDQQFPTDEPRTWGSDGDYPRARLVETR
jgi:hypothetical protein